jgi:preprotein translocase subunit SecA
VTNAMKRLGMEEGVPIESRWSRAPSTKAQKKVEGLPLRDGASRCSSTTRVMDQQRKTIYGVRQEVLADQELREKVRGDDRETSCAAWRRPCRATREVRALVPALLRVELGRGAARTATGEERDPSGALAR